MSKLLKSKFLFGIMVVAVLLVAGALTADAAYMHAGTLKQGMRGSQVTALQEALNVSPMSGYFGPITKAAVMAFQSSRGLTADGVVGPMTGAALAGGSMMGGGSYPAGCTSSSGYSTTTGMMCSSGGSYPAGCTSTSGFSPTTGAKCDGSTSGPTSGPLAGGAGSITVSAKSTYSSEDVIAGDEDAKVLAFEVEADEDSDVDITSVKVELKQTAAGNSDRIEDYMESVSIFMGSKKVGEVDADEFTENSDIYTKTISLDGAVVGAGDTEVFVVAVTALNNLDSGDINDDAFGVDVLNVRFEDGDGVVTTEDTDGDALDRTFDFDDLATSGDLELNLAVTSASPDAGSVEVDTVSTTDVTMLVFKLKAEGSDMIIDALELTGTSAGVDATFADIVSELSLEADGDEIDSISAFGDAVDDNTGDLWFTDLDFTIDEGDTVTFKVIAKVRAILATSGSATAFDQSDTLLVSFTAANLADTTNTDVEDSNGDAVAAGDRTGTGIGETQTFYSSGVQVDMGSVTYESVTDGADTTQVTYNIPLTVTAFGDTRYMGLAAQKEAVHTTITNDLTFSFAFQDSAAPSTDLEAGTSSSTFTCDADIEGGIAFRLDEGVDIDCDLQVILTVPENLATSMRVHVEGVQSYLDAALTNDATNELIQELTPAQDFQTAFKFITS